MNGTLLRHGFGTMVGDISADGDEKEAFAPDYDGNQEISTEELEEFFDEDDDGIITTEEFIEKIEDKIDKEIETIRNKRLVKKTRRLLSGIEDYTLLIGIVFSAIYFGMLLTMSSAVLGDTTNLDHYLSETFLDTGEVCEVIEECGHQGLFLFF